MGSAIGNYIHLSWAGYLGLAGNKHNTTLKKEAMVAAQMQEKRNKQLAESAATIERKQAEDMEIKINNFLSLVRNNGITKDHEDKFKEIEQNITSNLDKQLAKTLDFERGKLDVSNNGKNAVVHSGTIGQKIKYFLGDEDKKYFRVINKAGVTQNKFGKMIDDIEKTVKMMGGKNGLNQNISSYYDEIMTELKDISNEADHLINNLNANVNNSFSGTIEKKKAEIRIELEGLKNKKMANGRSILENLNDLLNEISVVSTAYYAGAYAESFLQAFLEGSFSAVEDGAIAGILNISNVSNTATDVEKNVYKYSNFGMNEKGGINTNGDTWKPGDLFGEITKRMAKNNKGKYHKSFSNESYMEIASVQQKADITITLPEDKQVGLSVKNYYLGENISSKNIALVSGSPFLYLMQNENGAFVNHFLNLNIQHPVNPEDKNVTNTNFTLQLQNIYNKIINLTLAIKGLTGSGLLKVENNKITSKNQAGVMVLNNGSTGKVYVRRTIDIIDKLTKNPSWIKVDNIPDAYNGNPLNGYVKTDFNYPNQRILDILAQMHQRKISVHINSNSITSEVR